MVLCLSLTLTQKSYPSSPNSYMTPWQLRLNLMEVTFLLIPKNSIAENDDCTEVAPPLEHTDVSSRASQSFLHNRFWRDSVLDSLKHQSSAIHSELGWMWGSCRWRDSEIQPGCDGGDATDRGCLCSHFQKLALPQWTCGLQVWESFVAWCEGKIILPNSAVIWKKLCHFPLMSWQNLLQTFSVYVCLCFRGFRFYIHHLRKWLSNMNRSLGKRTGEGRL